MIRRLLSVTAPIVWLVATAVLAAPADPLEVIPDDTLGLVVIKNMAEANRRVQGLTEKMKIPAPDLLSLDIDGNDFWVWSSLTSIRPRVVVVEYNSHIPPDRRAVQPYDSNSAWDGTSFFGASLSSFLKMGSEKGYRLVHTDSTGINLIFVDNSTPDVDTLFLPESDVISRVPNYYLYGLRHPEPGTNLDDRYVDSPPDGKS